MEEKEVISIPFVAHESAMNRMERANKRLWITIIVLIVGAIIYLIWPSEIDNKSQDASADNNSKIQQTMED